MRKLTIVTNPFILLLIALPFFSHSQVVLKVDGPGNTYELISRVLLPV